MKFLGLQFHCFNYSLSVLVISINQCALNGKPFSWTLVSRRSCFRAGTRLYRRGVDDAGHVANFVETEQILESSGDRSSFVQVCVCLKDSLYFLMFDK